MWIVLTCCADSVELCCGVVNSVGVVVWWCDKVCFCALGGPEGGALAAGADPTPVLPLPRGVPGGGSKTKPTILYHTISYDTIAYHTVP